MSSSPATRAGPMQRPSRLSYSYTHRDRMPGAQPRIYSASPTVRINFDVNRDPLIALQMNDLKQTEAQRRSSFMIKRQKPAPVLKPSPAFALGPDRAAYNAAMSLERLEAAKLNKKAVNEQNRKSARAQFIQERQQAAMKSQKRSFRHSRSH